MQANTTNPGRKKRTGLFIIGAILLIGFCNSLAGDEDAGESTSAREESEVTREDLGSAWPLTVESVVLDCSNRATVAKHNGTTYALNGLARQEGYSPIDPIWKDNPELPGTKLNIAPLLERATAHCE